MYTMPILSGDTWNFGRLKLNSFFSQVSSQLSATGATGQIWVSGLTGFGSIKTSAGNNISNKQFSLIAGNNNSGNTEYGTILNGFSNNINSSGQCHSILNGNDNYINSGYNKLIATGNNNYIGGSNTNYASILNGAINRVTGNESTYATILAGNENSISGAFSIIGNGKKNLVSGATSSIVNGYMNSALTNYSTVVNGKNNSASGGFSFIGGGKGNITSGIYTTIINGFYNSATIKYSFIGGGKNNSITTHPYSSIIGGSGNAIAGFNAFIGGGKGNLIVAGYSTIVGGLYNTISSAGSFIGGGENNNIDGFAPFSVAFGKGASANTAYSMVMAAGAGNTIRLQFSDGSIHTTLGTIVSPADFAEFFEFQDGNISNENRTGLAVSLNENGKILIGGDNIIGIVSARPAFIGDAADFHWDKKYTQDEFGNPIAGKLNPEYNDSLGYIPRAERKEWQTICLLGKIPIRTKEEITSKFIDINNDGTAINGTKYPVLKTIKPFVNDKYGVIQILFK